MSAVRYAHLKTDTPHPAMNEATDPDEYEVALLSAAQNPGLNRYFHEAMWRMPSTATVSRGVPLQSILGFHFGERPITGVDLGAGLHIALPLMNTPFYTEARFPGSDEIAEFARGKVNISLGVGIDVMPQRGDVDWAKACSLNFIEGLPSQEQFSFDAMIDFATSEPEKFPYVVGDVSRAPECAAVAKDALRKGGVGDGEADFVLTSFIRHQLDHSEAAQNALDALVAGLVTDGGIWIDIGEELLEDSFHEGEDANQVKVYQKIGGSMNLVGVPFELAEVRRIGQTNLSYFGV